MLRYLTKNARSSVNRKYFSAMHFLSFPIKSVKVAASADGKGTFVHLGERSQGAVCCRLWEAMTFGIAGSGLTSRQFDVIGSSAPCWAGGPSEPGKETHAVSAHIISVYFNCNQEKEYKYR